MLRNVSALLLVGIMVSNPRHLAGGTSVCGGTAGSAFILPSTPNVNALMIYVAFPSGGAPGTDSVPSFASSAVQHQFDYYNEMSYGTHHVNVQLIQRPSPNKGKAFVANNSLSYYQRQIDISGSHIPKFRELNTEILNQAYAENPNVFNGISVVFMFIGGNFITNATAWASLPEASSHYSGLGVMMEWGDNGADEEKAHKWHMTHEYGHLLSKDGTAERQLKDQDGGQPNGIYNIMHNVRFNVTQPLAAFDLIYLEWIKPSWIKEIDPTQSGDQSQTVTIYDTRLAPPSGKYIVVRIKIPGGGANDHFLIESRQGTGSDVNLASGGKGLIIWHITKSYGTYNTWGGMDVEIATAIGAHGQDWLDDGVGSNEKTWFHHGFL
jgi:hypothetical protein